MDEQVTRLHKGQFMDALNGPLKNDGTVRQQVKAIRKRLNMSQSGFAAALNVSKSVIGHYENGRRAPTPEIFEKMLGLSGVNPMELLPNKMPEEVCLVLSSFFELSTRNRTIFLKYLDPYVRNVRSATVGDDQ